MCAEHSPPSFCCKTWWKISIIHAASHSLCGYTYIHIWLHHSLKVQFITSHPPSPLNTTLLTAVSGPRLCAPVKLGASGDSFQGQSDRKNVDGTMLHHDYSYTFLLIASCVWICLHSPLLNLMLSTRSLFNHTSIHIILQCPGHFKPITQALWVHLQPGAVFSRCPAAVVHCNPDLLAC